VEVWEPGKSQIGWQKKWRMRDREKFTSALIRVCTTFALFACASSVAPGQSSTRPVGAQPPGQSAQPQSSASPETKITPKQAEQLFGEVDRILKFASDDSGLPIKSEVKRKLVSRDEVVAYLQENMAEDKGAQRLQRSELVLKKFGLLPPEFDLKTFLIKLLREQVAGYYDPKTKTVNLLDWIDVEQQRPVLAHELTHALQDQSFDLDKWMKAVDIDLNDVDGLTAADITRDESSDARQAVVEGQAMLVLIDYMLAPTGKTLADSPLMVEGLKAEMLQGSADTPEFASAPIFIKESLTFPYRYGLDFEAQLSHNGGKPAAFAQVFREPPTTTRQIMEPDTYISNEKLAPISVLNFKDDLKDKYDRFDIGAMGEFDVALLVDQYAGTEEAKKIYPGWRGGYYYSGRAEGNANAPLAIVYVSRWASQAKAEEFAQIYTKYLPKRYKHASLVEAADSDNQHGPRTWLTEEGTVTVHVVGEYLLITENFDQATTAQFDRELFSSKSTR
jgi:hypothetical protein